MRILRIGIGLVIGSGLLTGCDRPTSNNPAAGHAAALPADLFVKSEPADAKSVVDAKRDGKPGEIIAIRGRIGGSVEPFVADRAVFTIVDKSLPNCGEMSMEDSCKTPWDYCCEPKDKLIEQSATIQIAGADGRPLRLDLRNIAALKPTSEIVVKGKVSQKDGSKVLVIDAQSIYVKS
jgi:hypothetical protein